MLMKMLNNLNNYYTVWVVNFEGFNFHVFRGSLLSMKINHDIITAQDIKFSADPQKYKPTNSLRFHTIHEIINT